MADNDAPTDSPHSGDPETRGALHDVRVLDEPPEDAPVVTSLFTAPMSRVPMTSRQEVTLKTGGGIEGDRYENSRHRHVTIQSLSELDEAAQEHGESIDPALTRRNITISHGRVPLTPGIRWSIDEVELEVVRQAAPCKLLEDTLGRGAKLALHRRAGVICRVLSGGTLHIGSVAHLPEPQER